MKHRAQHFIAYNRMLSDYKLESSRDEKIIEWYIFQNFPDQLAEDNHCEQVRNLAQYMMSLYLNYIGCPWEFWKIYPDDW